MAVPVVLQVEGRLGLNTHQGPGAESTAWEERGQDCSTLLHAGIWQRWDTNLSNGCLLPLMWCYPQHKELGAEVLRTETDPAAPFIEQ